MYLIFYRFEGKPPVEARYRGSEPIKTYASRQRSMYRADQVEVFDESGALVCSVGPKPKRRTATEASAALNPPSGEKRGRAIKRRFQPVNPRPSR